MQTPKSPVTTHILDTSRGKPAANIVVTLETRSANQIWIPLSSEKTNADGRIDHFTGLAPKIPSGTYRLTFQTEPYFKTLDVETFYPSITVTFQVRTPEKHYHVPLLLNPFGYSTYRGT